MSAAVLTAFRALAGGYVSLIGNWQSGGFTPFDNTGGTILSSGTGLNKNQGMNPNGLIDYRSTVDIESMSITEQIYDGLLNPIEATVAIGLAVITPCDCCGDTIGQGALAYTQMMSDTMATANLANSAMLATHLIPF